MEERRLFPSTLVAEQTSSDTRPSRRSRGPPSCMSITSTCGLLTGQGAREKYYISFKYFGPSTRIRRGRQLQQIITREAFEVLQRLHRASAGTPSEENGPNDEIPHLHGESRDELSIVSVSVIKCE